MSDEQVFNRPNGLFAFVGSAAVAALSAFAAPWWVWFLTITWLLLWFFALIAQSDDGHRKWLVSTLRAQRFKQLYLSVAGPILTRLWHRYCDPAPRGSGAWTTFRAALTTKLYYRALGLAAMYPIISLIILWLATGDPGRLGTAVMLPMADFWPERALTNVAFAILGCGIWITGIRPKSSGANSWPIPVFLMVLSAAAATSFALVSLPPFTAQVVIGGLIALLLFPGGTAIISALLVMNNSGFQFVLVLVLLVVASIAVVAEFLLRFAQGSTVRIIVVATTIIIVLLWLLTLYSVEWESLSQQIVAMFLFLGVFPLINALFDVLSYAVTLTLMRLGLRRWPPLLTGLLDLGIAVILFLALGITLTAVVSGMNALAGVDLIDLGALFAGVREAPGNYLWLFAMLFSTILPTALHGILALGLGAQTLMVGALRMRVARVAEAAPDGAFAPVIAPSLTATLAMVPVAALMAFGWLVQGWSWPVLAAFGGWYHGVLLSVAHGMLGVF